MKISLQSCRVTCGACPYQLEAETSDGRFVYVRYRWGFLRAELWPNRDAFEDYEGAHEEVLSRHIGDEMEGSLNDEVREALEEKFEFPVEFVWE